MNLFLRDAACDVLILSSADLLPSEDAIERLVSPFADPEIGMTACRPEPLNDPATFMGFAAHLPVSYTHLDVYKRQVPNRERTASSGWRRCPTPARPAASFRIAGPSTGNSPMTPSIPLVDLKAAYRRLQAEIDAATARVLAGGWYILGPEVSAFEAEFAAYLGVEHAVGVASGTDAVLLALRALGVGPGDEVITVAHTAVATVAAIELAGATPRFVDIDPVTYTLDPARLAAAVTSRTRAIIPVHLYGAQADVDAVLTAVSYTHLDVYKRQQEDHAGQDGQELRG